MWRQQLSPAVRQMQHYCISRPAFPRRPASVARPGRAGDRL